MDANSSYNQSPKTGGPDNSGLNSFESYLLMQNILIKWHIFTTGQGHQLKAFKQAVVRMVTAPYMKVCGSVVDMAYSVFQTVFDLFGNPQQIARLLHGRFPNIPNIDLDHARSHTTNNAGCNSPGNHYNQ